MFRIPRGLVEDFGRYSLPAFINDAMWGLAFNMNSIIMGHLGSDIVAANSVVAVARDLVTVVGFGISAASSIMLGKEIGENRLEDARKDASSIMRVALISSIISGLVLLAISPFIPGLVKISETAAHYLKIMLYINVVYQLGQIINTVLIASLFRCGGDSKYGMILDIACMWGFAVPLGLISAFVLKLPPLIVYILMCTDEFAKMPFAIHHYLAGNWIKNITRDSI
jgi:Na+-driven multidrug efflux pump